jgi:membrane protease YdiL (CAAX protease family)
MENPEPVPLPPIEMPTFEGSDVISKSPFVEPSQQRAPIGWILLAMALLFYAMTIVASLQLAPKSAKKSYQRAEAEIRAQMLARSTSDMLTTSPLPEAGQKIESDSMKSLRTDAAKDARAARLLAAAEYEQYRKVDAAEIARLKKSKDAPDRAMASLYESKSLSLAEADTLDKRLPNTEFAYKLAKVHAQDKAGSSTARRAMAPPWRGVMLMGLTAFGGFLFLAGIVAWVVYITYRKSGQFAPLGHPAEPLPLEEADRLAFRSAILMFGFLVVQFLTGLAALAMGRSIIFPMIVSSILTLIMVFVVHQFPVLGVSMSLGRIGVTSKDLGKNVLWGLAGYAASIPILAVTMAIGVLLMRFFGEASHPVSELIQSGFSIGTALAVFLAGAIVAPFWEEVMFRGNLMPAIGKVLKRPLWGIVISSFIFAAIHPQGITLWLALGSIGAMNGMLAYQTKSLVPSIVLHCVHNSLILTLALVMTS